MRLLFFFSFLLSTPVFADCLVSDGTKNYKIPEKQQLSLFDKGRSLESHKIQDQDGLGTCYANATTAALKSVLPSHPDLSYLHAASSAATLGWEQEFNRGGRKYMQKGGTSEVDYVSGGYLCETIAAMKKAGGACPKTMSILENQSGVDSYIQQRLINGVGKYFDHLNSVKDDPKKFNQLKNELQASLDLINAETEKLKLACEQQKLTKFPASLSLKRLLTNSLLNYIDRDDDCSQKRIEGIKKFLSPDSEIKRDRITVKVAVDVEKEISAFLESDPELSKVLSEYATGSGAQIISDETAQKFLNKLDQYLTSKVPFDGKDLDCKDVTNRPERSFLLGKKPLDSAWSFLSAMKDTKGRDCEKLILEGDYFFEMLNSNNEKACLASESFARILEAVVPLATVGAMLNEELYANLTDPNSNHAFQLTNAIMPGCNKKQNLVPLNNVSCASFSMCDQSHWTDFKNNTYTGPKGGCYSQGEGEFLTRMKTINALRAGKAMGVTVCTAFMNDPKAKTNFCQKSLPGVEGHSYHAMAISGYRCNKGKIEYELLNSWGKQCPTEDGENNEAIVCDRDANGLPNGRFWIKEDVLVDSLDSLTSISVRKR